MAKPRTTEPRPNEIREHIKRQSALES